MITSWKKTQNDATADTPGGIYERQFFDGLGRLIQTQRQHTNWTGGTTGQRIITDMNYNAAGQAMWQSVPYLKNSASSFPNNPYFSPDLSQNRITNQYDAAGQIVRSVGLDDAVTSQIYGTQAVYSQDGNNHLQASFFDAYGRSLAIDEMINTFTDDFNDNNLNGWLVNGTAYASGGEAYLSGAGTWINHNMSETQDKAVTLSFKSADPNLGATLIVQHGTGANLRGWGLAVNGGQLKVYENVGGAVTYTPLMDFEPNTSYRVAIRNSKTSNRRFAVVVWEEDNPANMAEYRKTQSSSWYNIGWHFQANINSSGSPLILDNYEELDVNRTGYTYDSLGNLKTVTDPLGYTTSMTYDGLSRKIAMTDPDMGSWTYGYDNVGNLTSQTNNASQTITFEYDELNRLRYKKVNSIPIAQYTYDNGAYGKGQRTGMYAYTNAVFTNNATWIYDERGRVTEEKRIISLPGGNKTYTFNFGYSEGNLLTSMNYPGGDDGEIGETVTTGYWWQTGAPKNLAGQGHYVGTTANSNGATYNANGQMTNLLLGNGKTTGYTYNSAFRLQNIHNPGNLNLHYSYDKVGNITSILDVTLSNQSQNFSYDSLNRLVEASTSGGSGGHYDHDYAYNALGNLTSKTGVGTMGYGQATGIAPGAKPHAVTHLGGSQKFWYNANGNMTCRIEGQDEWFLSWTIENQLQQAVTYLNEGCESIGGIGNDPQIDEQVNFLYDADGMMVVRTENGDSTIYLGKLYQHDLAVGVETFNYVFNGMLVANRIQDVEELIPSGQVKFFISDHLGSTTTTLRANGTLEVQLRYDPWGNERWWQNVTPTGYRYTGQRQDDTLGLYDYNARYYDADIGRFISADTIVPDATNPQSFNRYTYVLNSPISHIDPTGHNYIDISEQTNSPIPNEQPQGQELSESEIIAAAIAEKYGWPLELLLQFEWSLGAALPGGTGGNDIIGYDLLELDGVAVLADGANVYQINFGDSDTQYRALVKQDEGGAILTQFMASADAHASAQASWEVHRSELVLGGIALAIGVVTIAAGAIPEPASPLIIGLGIAEVSVAFVLLGVKTEEIINDTNSIHANSANAQNAFILLTTPGNYSSNTLIVDMGGSFIIP